MSHKKDARLIGVKICHMSEDHQGLRFMYRKVNTFEKMIRNRILQRNKQGLYGIGSEISLNTISMTKTLLSLKLINCVKLKTVAPL